MLPPGGAEYTDRDAATSPGIITPGSAALKAFTDNGFTWGGTWSDPDYQHMSADESWPGGAGAKRLGTQSDPPARSARVGPTARAEVLSAGLP